MDAEEKEREAELRQRLEHGPPWPRLIAIVAAVLLFIFCGASIQFGVILQLELSGPLLMMPIVVGLTLGTLLASAWYFYERARTTAELLAFERSRRLELLEGLEQTVEARSQQLRETEARMQTDQKFTAIGRLSGGIAHDFNNILTTVSLGVFELGEPDTGTDERARLVDAIGRACERGAGITRQLQAIGAAELNRPEVLDLGQLIARDLGMWRTLAPDGIEVLATIPDDAIFVRVDPSQLHRVVLNLVVNACQAMDQLGKLTITVDRRGDAGPASIHVSDTGPGIPKAIADKIFEPFFTTKPPGVGTGLGLSVAHGIIEQAGGHIELDTSSAGTTFTIVLPAHEEAAPLAIAKERASGPSKRRLRIALLDDDATIGPMVARSLTRWGHEVETFDHPDPLLASSHCYDLLITDVSLPTVSGPNLARRFLDAGRTEHVILMSGYVDADARSGLTKLPDALFLQKPFTNDELFDALAGFNDE